MQSIKYLKSRVFLGLAILFTLINAGLNTGQGLAAPVTQETILDISSPTEGSVLSGEVAIMGSATHPRFNSYGVLYAAAAAITESTPWRMDDAIAWNVDSMVVNGQLGVWDTTKVPNGQYVLALVVYEVGNDTPTPHFVNNLTVQNEEPTATPSPEPTEEPTDPVEQPTEGTATEGDTNPAGPAIEQPPTVTPRPTSTPNPAGTAEPDEEEGNESPIADILSITAIKEAFTTGVWLAVFIYILGGLYIAGKATLRYYLRQQRRNQNP